MQDKQGNTLFLHDILHELHQHLGISITFELHSFINQLCLNISIVLNDTIMDNGQVMTLRIVGVSITR